MRTGKILKKIFEIEKISQKEFSENIGISASAISRMINGTLVLKEETLNLIVKNLEINKEQEMEIWKAWTLDRGEKRAATYFENLEKEVKRLKKKLESIKEDQNVL